MSNLNSAQNTQTAREGEPTVPQLRVDNAALAQNMSNTLEQILDVLRGSTIAEERGGDVESKFWATYKKVSDDYDNDFLDRANDDMAIILTFAGLFSAVNSTFIVGMQPNPGDTTNALILQMMNIMVNGPDAVNLSNLSSSTPYSSSTAWMQTLSYASLAFSLLAAFGAVLGKQWLNSYKAARARGSLKERGEKRQKKLNGIEYWQLQTVLKSFLILLQISLLLFGLSLSANMWIQQETISIVVMCTTAAGILFYVTTIFVSVFCPDSPFQTAETALIVVSCQKILTLLRPLFNKLYNYFDSPKIYTLFDIDTLLDATFITRSTVDGSVKSSAIRWLLETSTNPDVVEPAAAIVPVVQWPVEVDALPIYHRLRETLSMYRDRQELSVKCVKAMAHFYVESMEFTEYPWVGSMSLDTSSIRNRCIRDAFMVGCKAWDHLKMANSADDRQKHMADVRTALRTMVVYGRRDCLSRPDSSEVIQYGDLQWRHLDGHNPSSEEFDWLVDYLVDNLDKETDDETQGDALLVLSAMGGLGSDSKRVSYVNALIRCMAPTRPPRVRCAAMKCISDARKELLFIDLDGDSMSHGVDVHLFNELFNTLSTAISLSHENGDGPDNYHRASQVCYSRLIFVLTKNKDWRQRLAKDKHIQQCIGLFPSYPEVDTWIAGICLLIDPSGNDPALGPIHEKFKLGEAMRNAWSGLYCTCVAAAIPHDYLEILPALVTATRQDLLRLDYGIPEWELKNLARDVCLVGWYLRSHDGLDGNILSMVLGFSDDLNRMF